MYRLAIVVLLVSACGKSKKLKPGATCREAAMNSLKVGLTSQGRDLSKLSAQKSQFLAEVAMAITEHCEADRWSREAIECLAGGETPDNIGACKGTMTDAQEQAMSSAVDDVQSGAFHRRRMAKVSAEVDEKMKADEQAKLRKDVDETHDRMTKLAATVPDWRRAHPEYKGCPMFADIFRDATHKVVIADPWYQTIQVRCGKDVPAGVDMGFISSGPDRQMDTADDIKSW